MKKVVKKNSPVKKVKIQVSAVNPLGLNPYDFFRNEYLKYRDKAKLFYMERLYLDLRFPKKKHKRIDFKEGMAKFRNNKKNQIIFEARAVGKIIDLIV